MVIDAPAPAEPQQRFFVKLAMGVLPMLGRGAHFARVQSRPKTVVMKHGGQRNVLPTLVYPDDACLRADELRQARSSANALQRTVADLRGQLRAAAGHEGVLAETAKRLAFQIGRNAELEQAAAAQTEEQSSWMRNRYDQLRRVLRERFGRPRQSLPQVHIGTARSTAR